MKFILASGSPRRSEILKEYGYDFEVIVPSVDESMDENKTPHQNVMEVSYRKASKVFEEHQDRFVIACDTVVALDNIIYGKPHSKEMAYNMMKTFSGKAHEVISGVSILGPNYKKSFYVSSKVIFKELTDEMINEYIATDEPYDKAGGYAIQGLGRKLISGYLGSLYNIIGLPIEELKKYLDEIIGE